MLLVVSVVVLVASAVRNGQATCPTDFTQWHLPWVDQRASSVHNTPFIQAFQALPPRAACDQHQLQHPDDGTDRMQQPLIHGVLNSTLHMQIRLDGSMLAVAPLPHGWRAWCDPCYHSASCDSPECLKAAGWDHRHFSGSFCSNSLPLHSFTYPGPLAIFSSRLPSEHQEISTFDDDITTHKLPSLHEEIPLACGMHFALPPSGMTPVFLFNLSSIQHAHLKKQNPHSCVCSPCILLKQLEIFHP